METDKSEPEHEGTRRFNFKFQSFFTPFVGLVVLMAVYMESFLRCTIHLMRLPVVAGQHSVNSMLNCSIRV